MPRFEDGAFDERSVFTQGQDRPHYRRKPGNWKDDRGGISAVWCQSLHLCSEEWSARGDSKGAFKAWTVLSSNFECLRRRWRQRVGERIPRAREPARHFG